MPTDITISHPWTFFFSKNARFGRSSHPRPFVRKGVHELERDLVGMLSKTGPWYEAKTWLDIHVEMPNRKSDAINVVDSVADAVKKGIGVDDNWFSIHRLDWEIKRHDPTVTIRVFQEVDFDSQYCSYCNISKPMTDDVFHRSVNAKRGFTLVCKPCAKEKAKKRNTNNV